MSPANQTSAVSASRRKIVVTPEQWEASRSQRAPVPDMTGVNQVTNTEWTSEVFKRVLAENTPSMGRADSKGWIQHAKNFLHYYSGSLPTVNDYVSTVLGLWSGMTCSDGTVFTDEMFSGTVGNTPIDDVPPPANPTWSYDTSTVTQANVSAQMTQISTNRSSTDWVQELHRCLNLKDGELPAREALQASNYLGLLSLYLLRYPVKESSGVDRAISVSATKFPNLCQLDKLISPILLGAIPPPHGNLRTFFIAHFSVGSIHFKQLIMPVIFQLTHHTERVWAMSVLKATCGVALSYNGLAAISWFVRAAEKLGISQDRFIDYLSIGMVFNSVRDMYEILSMEDKESLITLPYCRLVGSGYEAGWSVAKHKRLVALCVAITEEADEDDEVWTFSHLSCLNPDDRTWGVRFGFSIREVARDKFADRGLTAEAREVEERAKNYQPRAPPASYPTSVPLSDPRTITF